jgi:hypothetical protein
MALGASTPAHANGRYPQAQHLLASPVAPGTLVMTGTYGMIVSSDGGRSWQFNCERGFLLDNVSSGDPFLQVLPAGAWLSGAAARVTRSLDVACDWKEVLAGAFVADITIEPAKPRSALALVKLAADQGGAYAIEESSDDGATWTPLAATWDGATLAAGLTLDSAPSDANRIYVTGASETGDGLLMVSTDHGAHYARYVITDLHHAPFIAAVDPKNPDALFVRTNAWETGADGFQLANDTLLYSSDAGKNWRQIFSAHGKMLAFAVSPDAGTLLVGYGDPNQPGRNVNPDELGIYRASTSDFTFRKVFAGSVSCLTWTSDRLYACLDQNEQGFEVGVRSDAEFDLTTVRPFAPLLSLPNVAPSSGCSPETSASICVVDWDTDCAPLGACANRPLSATDGGANAGAGGSGTSPLDGGEGVGAGAEPVSHARDRGATCGLGLRSVAPRSDVLPALGAGRLSFAVLLAALVRMRRRARASKWLER